MKKPFYNINKYLTDLFKKEKTIKRRRINVTEKQLKYMSMYMDVTKRISQMSYCEILKVGSVAVKDGRILSYGWNGTPTGFPNCCETENGSETLDSVLHSEVNLIAKIASSTETSEGSTIFLTHAPCVRCAKLLIQSKIKDIIYENSFKNEDGLRLMIQSGIEVFQYNNNTIKKLSL